MLVCVSVHVGDVYEGRIKFVSKQIKAQISILSLKNK